MTAKSQNLHRARAAKNDEFYTRYEDVKAECDNYLSHFFNKIIYCNCDTADSAFVKYFMELKSRGQIRDVWFSGGLGGDDFRSPKSIAKLAAADIVVTNPPFSLFREFIDLLIAHNKKFLVIGNMNATAYNNICKYIADNMIWIGYRKIGPVKFYTSDGDIRTVPCAWFTNLARSFDEYLITTKTYTGNEHLYKKCDNADALSIDKVANIPMDYDGVMAVPITFIGKYNPKQFIWMGLDRQHTYDNDRCIVDGKCLYARIFIRRKFTC